VNLSSNCSNLIPTKQPRHSITENNVNLQLVNHVITWGATKTVLRNLSAVYLRKFPRIQQVLLKIEVTEQLEFDKHRKCTQEIIFIVKGKIAYFVYYFLLYITYIYVCIYTHQPFYNTKPLLKNVSIKIKQLAIKSWNGYET
jgi:hypothetical protein